MTVEKIIRMLDNPATIGEALTEAAKLPFSGDDKVRFKQKQQQYIDGLSDHERPRWVGEMKNFLSMYEDCSVGATDSDKRAEMPASAQGNEFKTDIFISYARKDLKRVEPIVIELQKQSWSVFWDLEIPPGETWRSYIKKRLDESRCVLVLWSHHSIISKWVIAEADEADKRGILVPALLEAVDPPFGFSHIHAADLSDWNNERSHLKFRQCVGAITSKISMPLVADLPGRVSALHPPVPAVVLPKTPPNFVFIRGALFTMGSPTGEVDRFDNETQHQVKVSDFYLCRYAVTVAEFRKFVEASGYQTDAEKEDGSYAWDGKEWKKRAGINWRYGVSGSERTQAEENHPVIHVSWNDAVAYCKWMSEKTGEPFRLPTEAEWEYACRAGTTTPFSTGENLTTGQANYDGNYPYNNNQKGVYRENTVPVDSFAPNAWGFYNMHGNVWEWCGDWYGDKYYDECKVKGTVENPSGPETGSHRVLRGGFCYSIARYCRSAYRYYASPVHRSCFVGFRLVFVP
ncbi:MAG: SUMF1/EgtB/PvdO family nonheme iron enzyme [Chlorobiaceae bacterium]